MHWRTWLGLKPTEADFVDALLKGAPEGSSWNYDARAHTLTRDSGVLTLVNLYAEYSAAPKAARPDLLVKYRALLAPETISSLWSLAQTRIYPMVRSQYDRVTIDIDQRRQSEKAPPRAAKPYLQDLELVLGYDLGNTVSQVTLDKLAQWGVTLDEALVHARANLKALPTPTWETTGHMVWKLESDGGYQESFLQWPKVFEKLPFTGDILAAIPNRGVLIVARREHFDALADAVQKSLQERPWPLSGEVFRVAGGQIESFAPDACKTRLITLSNVSMHSVYQAQKEALQKHCDAIGEDVFVATFGLIASKEHPDQWRSWCSWTEGVESLLPKTDSIAFVKEPKGARKTMLVTWADAQAVVGKKMRETSEMPTRIQVDEFPAPEEWAALEQRASVVATKN